MKKYLLAGYELAIVDGELYQKLDAEKDQQLIPEPLVAKSLPVEEIKLRRTGPYKGPATSGQKRGRKPRFDAVMSEPIKEDIRAGLSAAVIAVKHNASVQTVYNIKLRMKNDGELIPAVRNIVKRQDPDDPNLKTFQCYKGHRFTSNLLQRDATCPNCGQKAFREIKDKPVQEE